MIRLLHIALLAILLSACTGGNQLQKVDLIVYTDFVNPQKTYDSLRKDIMRSGLVDSLTIVGRPLQVSAIVIDVDTPAVNRYRIPWDSLQHKLEAIVSNHDGINTLRSQYIPNASGRAIPLSAISRMRMKQVSYLPDVFLPTPETFYYNGERAVKVSLTCKQQNRAELVELLNNTVSYYSGDFIAEAWQFQIVD